MDAGKHEWSLADAREFLWTPGWAEAVVFTPPVDGRLREDQVLRRVGYQSGPTKVDLTVKYFRLGPGAAGDPCDLPELTRDEQMQMTKLRVWIAIETAPDDPSVRRAIRDVFSTAGRRIIKQRTAPGRLVRATGRSGRQGSAGVQDAQATRK